MPSTRTRRSTIIARLIFCASIAVLALFFLVLLSSSPTQAKDTHDLAIAASSASTDVTIVDFAFQPQVVTITVGSSVSWTNTGMVIHTSTSDTGVWDSGDLGPGDSFTQTFDTPGRYDYHCAHHPEMQGTVVVLTNAYLPLVLRDH